MVNLKDTRDVKLRDNDLFVDGVKAAKLKIFDDSSCIQVVLDEDSNSIIHQIIGDSTIEKTNIDNVNNVYEIMTINGIYYSFGDGEHIYIVEIDEDKFLLHMYRMMDEWCLKNAKEAL